MLLTKIIVTILDVVFILYCAVCMFGIDWQDEDGKEYGYEVIAEILLVVANLFQIYSM